MDGILFVFLVAVCCVIGWAIRILAADRSILGNVWRYRAPGWPSGVQEDDDLHWSWRSPPKPSGPTTEPLRVRIGFGRGTPRR